MKRRSFLKLNSSLLGAAMVMDPLDLFKWELPPFTNMLDPIGNGAADRISWRAYRGTDFEGASTISQVEGHIPRELKGTLFRNGPGTKIVGRKQLGHFFDGDAYLTAIQFDNGTVKLRSKFVQTKERSEEQKAGNILYYDFGTGPSSSPKGYKNNPNISVLPFNGEILALSEGGAPTRMDATSLDSKGLQTFEGSLPKDTSFSAHPKIDPKTGDTYSFGISQSISPALVLFKLAKNQQKLEVINSYRMGGFYPIHDMMITENYIIFVIPPLKVQLMGAALKRAPLSELLEYNAQDPLKFVIFKKNAKNESPIVITSQPSAMVYHHMNAYEEKETGNIVLYSMVIKDDSVFKVFKNWAQKDLGQAPESWITKFEIDIKKRAILSRKAVSDGQPAEFPCIDNRCLGEEIRYAYAVESELGASDSLAFNKLICWDLKNLAPKRVYADANQVFGEPLFVPMPGSSKENHEQAWIIHLGYDNKRDESFIDIRRPISLDLDARVWLGRFVPIGFHGQFVSSN